jgi:hypothetical protein
MDTLYFFFFCGIIACIVFWSLVKDDYEEFNDGESDKKFSLKKPDPASSEKERNSDALD